MRRLIRTTVSGLVSLFLLIGVLLSAGAATAATTATRGASSVRIGVGVDPGFVRQSLAGVHFSVKALDYILTFSDQSRPQRALTDNTARTITLFLRPGQTVPLTSKIIAYEIGHVIDFWTGTLKSRRNWLALRHAHRSHWWAPNAAPEWGYGSGDFADVFSVWATGSDLGYLSTVAGIPTAAQLTVLNRFFDRATNMVPDYRAP